MLEKLRRIAFTHHTRCGLAILSLFGIGSFLFVFGGISAQVGVAAMEVAVCAAFFFFMWIFAVRARVVSFCKQVIHLPDLLAACAIALFAAIFTLLFLLAENYIYYWDYGSYWFSTINLANVMQSDSYGALWSAFFVSVNATPYNAVISAVMVAPLLLGGRSYEWFYLAVCLFFYIPSAFLISATIYKFVAGGGTKKAALPFWLIMLAVVLMGTGLVPLLNGYVDAVCLLPLSILMYIAFERRYRVFNISDAVITSACILLIALGRRHFLYFLVGFTVAVLFVNAADIAAGCIRRRGKGEATTFFKNMLLIGGICIALLCSLFLGFALISLLGNYGDAYSAYSVGGIIQNLLQMLRMYGVIPCVLALLGIVTIVFYRKFYLLAFLLVSAIVTSVMFAAVQATGPQHLYNVYFQFCCFTVAGIGGVYASATRLVLFFHRKIVSLRQDAEICMNGRAAVKTFSVGCYIALSLVMALNFSCMTVFSGTEFAGSMTASRAEPKVRNDISVLEDMTEHLYSILEDADDTIYCIGSGEVFNDDILRKLYLPQQSKIAPNLITTAQVDLRDGFPVLFLVADIVITSSPCEYHLGEANQRVVSVLNNAVTGESPLNNNFTEKESFQLDKSIVAAVWVRTGPFEKEDIDYLAEIFAGYYPNYPELFETRIKIFA